MASIKASVHNILLRPIITEKGALVGSASNCYVFEVHPKANKIEIENAVKSVFKVEVEKVRTANYLGKIKGVGQKKGRRAKWKKAFVFVKAGQSIDFIEGL